MASKIKKGDTVKVIAGKDKEKEGKVLSVDAKNFTGLIFIFSCNNLYKVIFSNFMHSLHLPTVLLEPEKRSS